MNATTATSRLSRDQMLAVSTAFLALFSVAGLCDRTGNYTTGFMLLLALALIGAVAVSVLPTVPQPGSTGRPTEATQV